MDPAALSVFLVSGVVVADHDVRVPPPRAWVAPLGALDGNAGPVPVGQHLRLACHMGKLNTNYKIINTHMFLLKMWRARSWPVGVYECLCMCVCVRVYVCMCVRMRVNS